MGLVFYLKKYDCYSFTFKHTQEKLENKLVKKNSTTFKKTQYARMHILAIL